MSLKLFNKIVQKKIIFAFPFTVLLKGEGGQWNREAETLLETEGGSGLRRRRAQ